jgi:hypothetical protein
MTVDRKEGEMAHIGAPNHRRHPTRPRLRVWNTFTLWILHVGVLRRLADRQVCELRFTAARTGRDVVLPVMYAQGDDTLVVLVGGPEHKSWWHSFARPHPVRVWLRGRARTGTGRVVAAGAAGRTEAAAVYAARFPEIPVENDPVVVITLDPAG